MRPSNFVPTLPSLRRFGLALALLVAGTSLVRADDFDIYHPDEHYRRLGIAAWDRGSGAEAVRYLTHAARYADKAAQLGLAFVYLEGGGGVTRDPALAYAWADLAAERGYPEFLAVREHVWQTLGPSQQERAREVGAPLYAQYGDAVAKPRLEMLLRTGLSHKTGSHTGSRVGTVAVARITPSARASILAGAASHPDGSDQLTTLFESLAGRGTAYYYADEYWEPQAYWARKDSEWRQLKGAVEVAPLRPIGGH